MMPEKLKPTFNIKQRRQDTLSNIPYLDLLTIHEYIPFKMWYTKHGINMNTAYSMFHRGKFKCCRVINPFTNNVEMLVHKDALPPKDRPGVKQKTDVKAVYKHCERDNGCSFCKFYEQTTNDKKVTTVICLRYGISQKQPLDFLQYGKRLAYKNVFREYVTEHKKKIFVVPKKVNNLKGYINKRAKKVKAKKESENKKKGN